MTVTIDSLTSFVKPANGIDATYLQECLDEALLLVDAYARAKQCREAVDGPLFDRAVKLCAADLFAQQKSKPDQGSQYADLNAAPSPVPTNDPLKRVRPVFNLFAVTAVG